MVEGCAAELDLPVTDPVRFGVDTIVAPLLEDAGEARP